MDPASVDTNVLVLLLGSRSHARWAHFTEASGWVVVPLMSTGQALRELRTRKPQLAVMELGDPIDRSLRLLRLLRVRRPNVPVVVVPVRHTRQVELTVREIGAAGYVPEGCGSLSLTQLVSAVLARASVRRPGEGSLPSLDQGSIHDMSSPILRPRRSSDDRASSRDLR